MEIKHELQYTPLLGTEREEPLLRIDTRQREKCGWMGPRRRARGGAGAGDDAPPPQQPRASNPRKLPRPAAAPRKLPESGAALAVPAPAAAVPAPAAARSRRRKRPSALTPADSGLGGLNSSFTHEPRWRGTLATRGLGGRGGARDQYDLGSAAQWCRADHEQRDVDLLLNEREWAGPLAHVGGHGERVQFSAVGRGGGRDIIIDHEGGEADARTLGARDFKNLSIEAGQRGFNNNRAYKAQFHPSGERLAEPFQSGAPSFGYYDTYRHERKTQPTMRQLPAQPSLFGTLSGRMVVKRRRREEKAKKALEPHLEYLFEELGL